MDAVAEVDLTVAMPVYNEEATVEEIVERVLAAPVDLSRELVIVDDGSTDATPQKLRAIEEKHRGEGVRVFLSDSNRGKGAALRRAFAESRGRIILIQDADLEYDPKEYPVLLGPILDGRADVVYGSRFQGGPHRVHLFWHYVGNRFLTTLSNALFNVNLTDMETCYKVFTRAVLDSVELRANAFDIEPEMTAKFCKGRWRIYEVPISYSGRSYDEGKKIGWRDGLAAVLAILKFRFFD